mgnify:CR=1 FL=1
MSRLTSLFLFGFLVLTLPVRAQEPSIHLVPTGVITTAEAEVMRRRNHLRDIVVRVDDFPFDYNVATANKPAQSRLAA